MTENQKRLKTLIGPGGSDLRLVFIFMIVLLIVFFVQEIRHEIRDTARDARIAELDRSMARIEARLDSEPRRHLSF